MLWYVPCVVRVAVDSLGLIVIVIVAVVVGAIGSLSISLCVCVVLVAVVGNVGFSWCRAVEEKGRKNVASCVRSTSVHPSSPRGTTGNPIQDFTVRTLVRLAVSIVCASS